MQSRTPIVFILARRQRLAYLQVPKVACTSMRAALCRLNHPELSESQLVERGAFARHPEWSDVVEANDPVVARCFRFTFVRHPLDRFASFYRSKIGKRTDEQIKPHFRKIGLRAGMTPEEVFECVERVERGALDPHIAPQSYFVFAGDESRVQWIGRLERMEEGLAELAEKSGALLNVPHLNVTRGAEAGRPRDILRAALRQRLADFYADDLARFAYDP